MKFEEIDFYDYKIRMCVDNGIRMYLVSDLLRQYNEKHGTNKRFGKYLENKQAQEVIEHLAKTGENSAKNGQSTKIVPKTDNLQVARIRATCQTRVKMASLIFAT